MGYEAKITSKGQVTLPAALRVRMGLRNGDHIEFYLDHLDRVLVRPRNASPLAFLEALSPRVGTPEFASDDDAIAAAILARDDRSRAKKTRSK